MAEENGLENREAANYRAWVQILPLPPFDFQLKLCYNIIVGVTVRWKSLNVSLDNRSPNFE